MPKVKKKSYLILKLQKNNFLNKICWLNTTIYVCFFNFTQITNFTVAEFSPNFPGTQNIYEIENTTMYQKQISINV